MARRRRQEPENGNNATGTAQYVKLEQRLVLLAWLNDLLGFQSNRDLLADMKEAAEGFDSSGRSYIYHRLEARGSRVKVSLADLARYDDNIRRHLQAMNVLRTEPISLRYFQYLAVLYTEIFLDRYFNRRDELLKSLNAFVKNRNVTKPAPYPKFSKSDLSKLAFWMATGSGKTLIMHINYRQFLHYNNKPLNNILLITPNEGLSKQHMAEMKASNIPCRRFDLNESSSTYTEENVVRVIEITKLVEEKRGEGESVPVEAFEGNNLIFVDEGHKGSGGETWRKFRNKLAGKSGFTFEYSATFGQALTAARNDLLTAEYGKAIIFDYSYRYFHGDGYGKDFRVLNLRKESEEGKTEKLLLGNLLSFYEQMRVFEKNAKQLRPYNLERPLLVFAGSSVNAVYNENRRKRSDVLTVVRFLHHLLIEKKRSIQAIADILEGRSGLRSPNGSDLFSEWFPSLRADKLKPDELYEDMLRRLFHASSGGGLHLCDMRGHPGELGLKAGGARNYFGVVYIGDTNAFKKLVEDDDAGIILEDDVIADSLFAGINDPHTTINILVGAKKFMEGWNSWRICSMGLLNIGRSEGAEIIQLFGRGVRLRGKHLSLKRSSELEGPHPEYIGLLETLNIFAVRADYMSKFREYLEKEGVAAETRIELKLPTQRIENLKRQKLYVPRVPSGQSFMDHQNIVLEADSKVHAVVDLSTRVESFASDEAGVTAIPVRSGEKRDIPDEYLELVDWEKIYLDLLMFKKRKGLDNLVIRPDAVKKIMKNKACYTLIADETTVQPSSFHGINLLQTAVQTILRRYVEKFYRVRQQQWLTGNLELAPLDDDDSNFFQNYVLTIPAGRHKLIEEIKKLLRQTDRLYEKEDGPLSRIHFDRHLYQPLLVAQDDDLKTAPPGLNEGERKFVEALRTYCSNTKNFPRNKELFLLRNLSRGKGVGFFYRTAGFYPDFILWITDTCSQRIVFIEPHGMIHAGCYEKDDKARLHEFLRNLKLQHHGQVKVTLDSFIISTTPYEDLKKVYDDGTWTRKKFEKHHILFPDDAGYIRKILESAP